jgi:dipeptidase E
VLLVNGGDALYLAHWMRECGLADLLPSLDTVWVGLSGGSMVMSPRIGEHFVGRQPPDGRDEALGVVDFSIFPHVDHDETAIKVVGDAVEVVSGGHWKLFER